MDSSGSVLFYNPTGTKWLCTTPVITSSVRNTRSTSRAHFLRSSLQKNQSPDSSNLLPTSLIQNPTSEDELLPSSGESSFPSPTPTWGPAPSSILDYLWSHPFYKRLMGPLISSTLIPSSQIAESLANNTLLACYDGSHSPNAKLGSHAWVFTTSLHSVWCGAGPIDGHPTYD